MPPTIDEGDLRKRVMLKIATAPSVLIPTVVGASALIGAWGLGEPVGVLSFLGIAGVLAGLGALATRWIFGVDRVTKEVIDDAELRRRREAEEKLDRLDRQLRRDRDPRSQKLLRRLRDMFEQFRAETENENETGSGVGVSTTQLTEITAHAERLFRSCVASLERSLVLWKTSKNLNTESARHRTLEARERVFEEVQSSIDHLAGIFDGIRMLSLGDDGHGKMTAIRTELEQSLDVARRVEDRMQSIRDSLERDLTREP